VLVRIAAASVNPVDVEIREGHGRILREVAELADAGKVRPLLDEARFTLDRAPDAHRRLASGEATGKIVVDVA
jgi:NADPH:quinone reductase-like Zn-dependent oxidoreductase